MRRQLGCLVLSLGLLASAAQVQASNVKLYFGAGFSDGAVQVAEGDDKAVGNLSFNVGLQLLDFVAIELALGSASDQSSSLLSEPLVSYQAALLRLGYRWDRTGVYLLGGQAMMDIDESLNDSDEGVVYGFGINLFGNEKTALNLNYMNFDDGAFTATTIGFQHYFGGFR